MKTLTALFLALAVGGTPAWADVVSPYVFNLAGLRVVRLDPSVTEVGVNCVVLAASDTLVASGRKIFPVTLLPDRSQGFGVESGPFLLAASHVESAALLGAAQSWQCSIQAAVNGRWATLREGCPNTEPSAVTCSKAGTEAHTRHTGSY